MFVLAAGVAQGGGLGGLGGGLGKTATYDSVHEKVLVRGSLNDTDRRFEIIRRGMTADAGANSYVMEAGDFARLQKVADSGKVINVIDEHKQTLSCRAESGDQPQQVKLIERRPAMRSSSAKRSE